MQFVVDGHKPLCERLSGMRIINSAKGQWRVLQRHECSANIDAAYAGIPRSAETEKAVFSDHSL